MIDYTNHRGAIVPSVEELTEELKGSPLTMITPRGDRADYFVLCVTSSSAGFETTQMHGSEELPISECPPHRWLIGKPRVAYSYRTVAGKLGGDMIETTEQVCQKCGLERTNRCVLPLEKAVPFS